MKVSIRQYCSIAALCFVCSAPAAAQETPRFELTPFVGYRFGGSFDISDGDSATETEVELDDGGSAGLLFDIRHTENTTYQLLYSLQRTDARINDSSATIRSLDTDIHVLQLGGTYRGQGETVRPYLAATVGGTHVRTSGNGRQDDTFFSGSIGVGVDVVPNNRLGLRFEARAYGTLTDSDTELFCRTGPDINVCAIRVEGTILGQFETFAGFTFRF